MRLFASEARVRDLTVHHARPPCGSVDGALWFQRRPSRVSAGVAAVLLHREALVDGATTAVPVELSATVELIVDHRRAKALGLTIPRSILPRETEFVE
jgi:hypothetical protein